MPICSATYSCLLACACCEAEREVAVVLGAAEVRQLAHAQAEDAVGQRVGEVDVARRSAAKEARRLQCLARPPPLRRGRLSTSCPTTLAAWRLSTNQFKNGNHIEVDGTIFKIVDFQHVKPGKGGAFVRTKLRRAADGNVIDRTFRAGEKFRSVRTESRKMQFLYADGTDAHFMDTESFEQIAVPESGGRRRRCAGATPSSEVDVLFIDEQPADVQLPSAVDLEVTQTDPGAARGLGVGGGTKPATLETGAVIQVPLFVEQGQRIRVDTRSGDYVARA